MIDGGLHRGGTSHHVVHGGAQPVRCNVVNPGWTRTEMADREMTAFGNATGLALPSRVADVIVGR